MSQSILGVGYTDKHPRWGASKQPVGLEVGGTKGYSKQILTLILSEIQIEFLAWTPDTAVSGISETFKSCE